MPFFDLNTSSSDLALGEFHDDGSGNIYVMTKLGLLRLTGTTPKGTTGERPTLTSNDAGFQYFDTTIGSAIWWNGSAWI